MKQIMMKRWKRLLNKQMSDDTISASKISPKLVRGYRGFYNRVVKRAIDFVLALFFIIILAPLLVVISVFIVIDDGFPILYKADRGGYKGTEKLIFQVRPGITDYSSIEFINLDEMVGNENADEMYEKYILPKKNKLRVKYAATVSFTTDCQLFFCTVWKVLEKVLHIIRK